MQSSGLHEPDRDDAAGRRSSARKATRKLSGFDRVPDLTAWLRCGATSVNRKRGFFRRTSRGQKLQALRPFAQFETLRRNKWAPWWPQRHIMLPGCCALSESRTRAAVI